MKTRKPTAVVVVQGGVVQYVLLNDSNMKVIVVDYDVDGCDPKGMKKDHDGTPCNYDVWSGKNKAYPDLVRNWSKKNRIRKPKTEVKGVLVCAGYFPVPLNACSQESEKVASRA